MDPELLAKQLPQGVPEEESLIHALENDSMSVAETKQLSSGLSEDQIRKRSLEKEASRTERFRDNFEHIAILTLWVVWIALVIIGILWVYHIIAPPTWWRLPAQQVSQLQSIVTGGLLAGLAGGHLKKRLQ